MKFNVQTKKNIWIGLEKQYQKYIFRKVCTKRVRLTQDFEKHVKLHLLKVVWSHAAAVGL